MLAIFLGAGFSKWAADLPVASQLFDFDIEPWGPRERRNIEIVKSIKQNWDKRYPQGLSEQFIADALRLPEKDRKHILKYITRRLSEPFIWKEFHAQKWRRQTFMIDENRRFQIDGVLKAKDFLQQFCGSSLAGIITTNYDMLVEYALGTKGFNYGIPNQRLIGRGPYPVSQWRSPVTLKGDISIAKIHGSVSWDETCCYTDGRRGLTGHALIVAPTPEKQPPESLKYVWELAGHILHRATQLLVFGFAFNPYDEAVLNLLRIAGRNLKYVRLIDVVSQAERAHRLWPNAKITFCKPLEGNKEVLV